jgi:RNA polymerase sigma-70 factor (ECF subfamily)
LPADFRVAVVLCDLEQLSYEEIAATLGIKVGTVRSRIHRGRVLLRQALAHRDPRVRPVAAPELAASQVPTSARAAVPARPNPRLVPTAVEAHA